MWIPHHVQQLDDILSSTKVLQDFNFTSDLLLLDGLEDLDHTALVLLDVDTLEHFTVLAPSNLTNNFIIILAATREEQE